MSRLQTLRIVRATGAIVILAALIPIGSGAQTATPRRELRAAKAGPIKLDGRLDEPSWTTAPVGSDFVQRYPDPGLPATMRTEVRILYDADAIYVGARMFDPHPDSIAAPLGRRDPGDLSSDWIDVIFDSYNDRRTAYRFGVNPAGTKLDVYHFNDDDDDNSWNALWDVATRIDSLGWTAEYRIPLSQLRFHASSGEQVWGLQFYRAVARRDEWTFWSPFTPSMPGFVSAMGILRGLENVKPGSTLEVTPYLSSQATTARIAPGDPFGRSRSATGTAGADFRVALGPAISLTGAINPDFGQVEVDPAVLNLSAVETFLPEKRPFFLEGSGIFDFGSLPVGDALSFSRFIHWRRIGRQPQLQPDAAWTDTPAETTILGAAKVSGQISGGWSVGLTEAVTQHETAKTLSANGVPGLATVEPLSNYLVTRAKRDFNEGRATLGLLGTAVNRSLDSLSAQSLRSSAYVAGLDGTIATTDRRFTLGGFFAQSVVAGSTSAITATQRSSVHYFQQPDSPHLVFDGTRRRMTGHDAALGLVFRGRPWFGAIQVREITPGYEPNDLGYASRADVRTATADFGGFRNNSQSFFRSSSASVYTQNAWNFDGRDIYRRFGVASSAQLRSFWNVAATVSVKPQLFADRLTRGGPLLKVPSQVEVDATISTDGRRQVLGNLSGYSETKGPNGFERSLRAQLRVRPSASLDLSIAPTLQAVRSGSQYVRTVADSLAIATYANRYVFATLQQRTLSVDTRADWILTPQMSFQLFAQPFVSTARFRDYKEFRKPGTFLFDVYGRDRGTINKSADGTIVIDPDASGPAPSFMLGTGSNQTSFATSALRVNAVFRWEYRSGSALYLVWQQSRDAQTPATFDGPDERLGDVFNVPSKNVFLIKASYRIGR